MKFENENACGRGPESMMPVEDLTNILHETRALAQEAGELVDRIGIHLFGHGEKTACCGEEKCSERVNFKEELDNTRRSLRETIEDLAKLSTLVGV